MDAKEYLESYSNYARIEMRCREECKAEKETLRDIALFYNRSATRAWRKENAQSVKDCIKFCDCLQEKYDEVAEKRYAILDMIDSIPGSEGDILRLRYVDGLIWEEIGDRVCYSYSAVFRKHEKALQMVQDIIDRKENGAEPYQEQ